MEPQRRLALNSEPSPLRLNLTQPSVSSAADLLRGIEKEVESRWPGLQSADGLVKATAAQRSGMESAHKHLLEAWEACKAGLSTRRVLLPLNLAGIEPMLAEWQEDLSAWQLNQVLEDSEWKLAIITWAMRGSPGTRPSLEIPDYPCDLVQTWEEEQTWFGLMPSPGLSPAWTPAVIRWPSAEAVRPQSLRLIGFDCEMQVASLGDLLWSPQGPEAASDRNRMLQMAHLQRAVFLAD